MKVHLCSIVLICCALTAWAQEKSVYGGLDAYGIAAGENDSYLSNVGQPELSLPIRQHLNMNFNMGGLTKVNTEVVFTGTLLNIKGEVVEKIAPVDFSVNQMFLQVPLYDTLMLYAGKRVREMGKARKFPLVNRINPRLYKQTRVSSQGAGLVEVNFFPLYWLNTTAVVFFKDVNRDSAQLEDLNGLVQTDITMPPIDVSLYGYMEETENFPVGCSASAQIRNFTLYGEYLYKKESEVKVLTDDTQQDAGEAFEVRDEEHYHGVTTGLNYRDNTLSLSLEYAYNTDGLSVDEADDMKEYIETYEESFSSVIGESSDVKAITHNIISLYRNRNGFLPHYLDISAEYSPEILNELSVNVGAVISAPGSVDDLSEYWGYNARAGLRYAVNQFAHANLKLDVYGGGDNSEYVLYELRQYSVMLGMNIRF